jgi:hypothetical protein
MEMARIRDDAVVQTISHRFGIWVAFVLRTCHTQQRPPLNIPTRISVRREYRVSNRGQKESRYMVRLDEKLLLDASRCVDGTNVHLLQELMFAYERAVELHSAHTQGHGRYDSIHELRLRSYVVMHHVKKVTEQSNAAVKRANSLIKRSIELQAKSQQLEIRADAVTYWSEIEPKTD